jgi:hypothetical protein
MAEIHRLSQRIFPAAAGSVETTDQSEPQGVVAPESD